MSTFMTTDEATVRAIIAQVYGAWEAGDSDSFVSAFADQATAIFPGAILEGKDLIRATIQEWFDGTLKGTRGFHEIQQIRFIEPCLAVVINRGGVLQAGKTEPIYESRSWETWVMAKGTGGWRVQALHNSRER